MEEALGALHDEPPPFTFSCVPLCCVHIAQQHTAAEGGQMGTCGSLLPPPPPPVTTDSAVPAGGLASAADLLGDPGAVTWPTWASVSSPVKPGGWTR